MQHNPHHRTTGTLLAVRRALGRRPHQAGRVKSHLGHRVAKLVVVPLHQLLVKMLHVEVAVGRPE